jgi:predicted NodU family carbamoyl transferase
MSSTNILGIFAYYHDSAACLVRDGEIVAAAQEERFTRKKHDYRFPADAVEYCLRAGGIKARKLITSLSTTRRSWSYWIPRPDATDEGTVRADVLACRD